jgi:sugar-specific transcriptional regulator TrmB
MEELAKKLEEFGLSSNESLIYIFLLKSGSTTTGRIIKETQIVNSRVYESLNSLIAKGIVSYNVQKDGKHFSAIDPKIWFEKEAERRKRVESLVPQLSNIRNTQGEETKTAVYEGFEGFKIAFKNIINDCPKNGEIFILGFSDRMYKTESLRLFLSNMNLKTVEKKQKLKIILDKDSKEKLGRDRESEKNTEVKYMPKGYINPAAMDIFEDYVYMFLWEEKPFVFMIKNKTIAESFKQYFKMLWRIAK